MKRDIFVYLSGPMTAKHGYSVEENTAAGVKVYLELMAQGVHCFSPHLSGAFPSAWSALTWEQWLAYDYAVIDRCTHVVLLPRYETSAGALKEVEYAKAKGVPVMLLDDFREMLTNHASETCGACR